MDCEEIWTLLVSHGKLERDKGVARVQEELSSNGSVIASLIQRIEAFRIDSGQENTSWETKLGILSASKAIVDGGTWRDSGERFLDCCLQRSKALLTDEEGTYPIYKLSLGLQQTYWGMGRGRRLRSCIPVNSCKLHSRFFYKQFFYKHWGSNSQKIKQFLSICWGWSWSKNKHWVKQSEARQNLSIGKHFEPGERSIDGPNFSFLYAPNRYEVSSIAHI